MSEPISVITTHVNSDFDAIASMLAAQKLYPDAKVVFPGSSEKNSRDFFVSSMVYLFNMGSIKTIDLSRINQLILVDTRQPTRIGRFADILDRPGLDIHIYDHHPYVEGDIVGQYEKCRTTGATVTILTEIIKDRGIELTEEEATILCLGLYEDTGSFNFLSTTPEDMMMGAYLLSNGANLDIVSSMLSREITQQQVGLLNDMIHSFECHHINGIDIMITMVSTEDYVGDLALVVQKLMKMENPCALFVLARMGSRIYLIARSKISEVDVGAIIRTFGGGGHSTAASASIKDQALAQVKRKLVETLYLKVHSRQAHALMSSPAYTIPPDTRMADAKELLQKYNINALLVTDKTDDAEKVLGLISRQVVEKSLFHNLENVPVREYMSSELDYITPDADLASIQEKWIGNKQRLLPVIDQNHVVGVITRTDLFTVMLSHTGVIPDQSPENWESSNVRTRKVTHFMKERLSERLLLLLMDIGNVAEKMSCNVYVVGGFVRDLLLNRKNEDVDIVVEGDGIAFAKKYAKHAGARIHPHEKFGTAVIIFSDGFKIDVATARTEHYASPAALPTVEQSSIKLDLYRRDFTINTLIIHLNGDKFGTLIDFFGAYQDIKEKVVRVLHNLSLVEDPTRVFRAIRFEQRFGFHIGKLTDHLIKNSVKMDFVKQLGGRRVFSEIKQILQEDNPLPAIKRISGYGILKMIGGKIHLNPKMIKRFESIKKVLAWHELLFIEEKYVKWAVYFMAIIHGARIETIEKICEYLDLSQHYNQMFCQEKQKALRLLRSFEKSIENVSNSQLYHAVKYYKTEILLYMMASARKDVVVRMLSNYHSRLKRMKPFIGGKELKQMGLPPGPLFSKILEAVLDARLDNLIETREDEIAFVEAYIKNEN
ncbi:tRNA nucleotidyltransferase/poly(A) polymerase [Candidatus Magnetomorum sp. HK-1]|nr:tRNA nucleotidyltransferase/poly(A) polymerase [Candidatus Magnetomorum sp. HK-1]